MQPPHVQARQLIGSVEAASRQAGNTDLVRGVLACGFYPLLGCPEASAHLPSGGGAHRTRLITASGEEVGLAVKRGWPSAGKFSSTVLHCHVRFSY